MERIQLTVELRHAQGKGGARKVRAKGLIPGVIYGKGIENINVVVHPKEFSKALSGTSGMNTMLDMEVPNHGKVTVMLKDYQADNILRKFTHVDFLTIDLSKKLKVEVPIQIIGKAEGVKEGGILELIRRELTVICLPTHIPKSIEVDVSTLKIGQSIHIDDLKLPTDLEVPHDQNFTIASVVAPRAEEVVTATPAEGAPTEPEVLTAKKPAEGEAAEEKKGEGKAEKDKK
jgi:large subunit ribosomal protein L25